MTKKMGENSFEISSGISQMKDGRGSAPMYPWSDMKAGDSFFVSTENEHHRRVANTVYNCGRVWLSRRGLDDQFRISQRRVEENGVKGVRVWMLARSERISPFFGGQSRE